MPYTKERKEAVLRKMLPPHNKSIPVIAKEEGISEPTLYGWRAAARAKGRLLPKGDTTPEGWTSADKFAAVVETASLNEEQKAAYCRGRGIYPEQLAAWQEACAHANDWDEAQSKKLKESMKESKKRTQELERELLRNQRALAETAALLVLKKKSMLSGGRAGTNDDS